MVAAAAEEERRGRSGRSVSSPFDPTARAHGRVQENCWFCLANPQVTKHLIASIGNETYVTLPKGQLPDTESSWPVPGGGHVLIIPVRTFPRSHICCMLTPTLEQIAHYPSLLALPTELALPVVSEIETFKSALRSCYASFNAAMVTFEVAKVSGHGGRSGHAHLQVCPVPEALADQVEAAFRQQGEKMGVAFEEGDEAVSGNGAETNYFRVGLPDGRTLVHRVGQDSSFNLQFGR